MAAKHLVARAPRVAQRCFPRSPFRAVDRAYARAAEVVVQRAVASVPDEVDWARGGDRGDGQAGRQRLEDDVAEGFRPRRKDEAVRAGIVRRQVLAAAPSAPDRGRESPLQFFAGGTVADDYLRARQVEGQKALEALLDRDASDVKPDRPWQLVDTVA